MRLLPEQVRALGKPSQFDSKSEGCNIAINYRKSSEDAEETEEMAMQKACGQVSECGVKSLLVQGDVSTEEDVIDIVNTVVDKFGSLDILINNAGIQKECPSHEISTKDFDNVLSVNLRGAFLCAGEAIKHFLPQNGGIIINVSSVHEIIPRHALC